MKAAHPETMSYQTKRNWRTRRMTKISLAFAALCIFGASNSLAQVASDRTVAGCFNTAVADATVLLEGRLATGISSNEYGKERFYLLELRQPICIDDGGEFADPTAYFSEVQVVGTDQLTWKDIRKSIGRTVKVSGAAFAAHTMHHHRPMVLLVGKVLFPKR